MKTKIVSCHTVDSEHATGGQWYSDTSPFSFPWCKHKLDDLNTGGAWVYWKLNVECIQTGPAGLY
jgi:hypothetical protein